MAEANKKVLIPKKLWIYNQVKRGKVGNIWHCTIYISRNNRPMRSLKTSDQKQAEEIAKKALKVASDICVFTNNNVTMEKI